jgi:hypothetical protein
MNFILKYGFPLLSGLNSIDQKPLIFRGTSLSRALLKWPLVLLSALFPFYFFACIPLAHFNLLPSVLVSLLHDHIFRTSFVVCGISTFAFAALCLMASSGEKKSLARVAEGLFVICLVGCFPCYFLQKIMSMVAPEVFFGASIMCALLILCSDESNDASILSSDPAESSKSSKMVSITSFWAVVASVVLMLQGLNGHVDLFVSGVVMAGCIGACILARAVEVCWDRPAKDAFALNALSSGALPVRAGSVMGQTRVAQERFSAGPDSKRGSGSPSPSGFGSGLGAVTATQLDRAGEDCSADGDVARGSDSERGSDSPSRSGSRSGSPSRSRSDSGSGLEAAGPNQLDIAREGCSADGDVSGGSHSERGSDSERGSGFGSGEGFVTADEDEDPIEFSHHV